MSPSGYENLPLHLRVLREIVAGHADEEYIDRAVVLAHEIYELKPPTSRSRSIARPPETSVSVPGVPAGPATSSDRKRRRVGARFGMVGVLEVMDFVTGWCSPHMRA